MPLGNKSNSATWSDWDFNLKVAARHVPFIEGVSKYGFNSSVVAVVEDVWSNGGVLQYLTSDETMNIVSSSASDDGSPLGTGARTVTIFGLDANYKGIRETITLNGTTNVLTTSSFIRIIRMRVDTVGSGGVNTGTISATSSSSATIQASIPTLSGATFKSHYTVPSGFFAFIRDINYGALNNDQVQFDLQTRAQEGSWITRDRVSTVENFIAPPLSNPLRLPPKSDVRVQVVRIAGSGNVQVSVRYEMHLIKEDYINKNSILVDET